MANQTKNEKSHVFFIFAYVLIWLSGIIVYVTEGQKDRRLKFHSLQAIFLGVIIFILFYIPFVRFLWILLGFLLWLYGMWVGVKAYSGEDIDVPVLGEYARKYSK